MRVLVTADTIGGVWIYTRELVTGLAQRGVEVTLVSFGELPAPTQLEWLEGLPGVEFHPTAFRLEWMQEARQDIGTSSDYLMSLIEETRPDVLHLNQFSYGALPTAIPKLVVAHSDVVSWWDSVHESPPPDDDWMRWYRGTVSAGLQGAAAVVAPTRWMLEAVERFYGAPQRPAVIYNGRNPLLLDSDIAKEDFVLSVGRAWDAGKQLALLSEIEMDIPLRIVGQQRQDGAPWRQARSANGRGIEFLGSQSEVQLRQWYGRAGIYAATSRYEPFGLAPLEAALSRCAVIANDIPSFRELWGQTACYFRRNDAASLAETIRLLRRDRELRTIHANLAYNRARQRFTAEKMVDKYLSLYKSLASFGVAAA